VKKGKLKIKYQSSKTLIKSKRLGVEGKILKVWIENSEYVVALHFINYNFARPHKTHVDSYPKTPAMTTGLTNYVWAIEVIES
jgi:hypothetical protein